MITTQWNLIEMGVRLRMLVALGLADLAMTLLIQLAVRVLAALGPFLRMST